MSIVISFAAVQGGGDAAENGRIFSTQGYDSSTRDGVEIAGVVAEKWRHFFTFPRKFIQFVRIFLNILRSKRLGSDKP